MLLSSLQSIRAANDRPLGPAMVVGSPAGRQVAISTLRRLGYQCVEADDVYAAMADLCRRPLAFRAVVLILGSLYREELGIITAVKRRFPHVNVYLSQIDGRTGAVTEGARMGADGLLTDTAIQVLPGGVRSAGPGTQAATRGAGERGEPVTGSAPGQGVVPILSEDSADGDPVLTADELKALLQDVPSHPGGPGGGQSREAGYD